MNRFFFKKVKNIKINDILKSLGLKSLKKNFNVNDINELNEANINDISFYNSNKYFESLKKTKSKLIITNKK